MKKGQIMHKLLGTTPGRGIQPKEAVAYSVTGFAQNLICTIISAYLMVFMTDALHFDIDCKLFNGISAVVAVAYLMLLTRIFDALNDPIMGSIVDKTRTKWGKCRPYLKWMAIPIAVVTIVCFLPVYPNTTGGFIAISIVYVLWSMVYTVCDVPYWGLSTAMTNDTTVRGKVLTVTRLVCMAGAGLVSVVIPLITSASTKEFMDPATGLLNTAFSTEYSERLKWTYFICTAVIVVVSVPMFFYGFKNTKERYTSTKEPPTLGHNIKLLFKNKQLLLLVLSGILGAARTVYTGAGGLYFAKYALANESLFSVITMLAVPGGLIASIFVPYLTEKIGKKKLYIISHLAGAAAMFVVFFVGYQSTAAIIIAAVGLIIAGIPLGISNIVTYAMIGDTVEYLEWKTGERAEGICFAMQTFINKIGLAANAFIGVIAYAMAGISPQNPGGSITQDGLDKLWTMLILSCAASLLLTVIPMFFYKITENRQREMVAEIEERNKAEN